MTKRQQTWANAAERAGRGGNEPAAALFTLIAQPNEREREHSCREHSVGFRRDGRRGFKCGICRTVIKWVDPAG